MSEDVHEAEEAVTATTDSYGGPVSDEELAEVYLPAGQDQVDTGDSDPATESGAAGGAETPPATAPAVEPPD